MYQTNLQEFVNRKYLCRVFRKIPLSFAGNVNTRNNVQSHINVVQYLVFALRSGVMIAKVTKPQDVRHRAVITWTRKDAAVKTLIFLSNGEDSHVLKEIDYHNSTPPKGILNQ